MQKIYLLNYRANSVILQVHTSVLYLAFYLEPRRACQLKDYGEIDSKFRYVVLAAMRAKQLLGGAKPRLKSRSKNLIRIAQEEVKQGLVDFEIIKATREEKEEIDETNEEMFIGEELTPETEEKPEVEEKPEKETKAKKKPEKSKKS
jgi:DNA-directed RNA polymerase subunit omega